MASARPDPSWILKDPGSFASIHVKLPPGSSVNCESDAVVTFSQGVEVRGVMSGGIFGALARAFLTNESFFTTVVENMNRSSVAEVMMAPSEPGGIILHKLMDLGGGLRGEGGLLLTSGAYVASDFNVKVTSEVQTAFGNSLMSGTGFFLLRASGRGYVACGAHGSVHKYVLGLGEIRSVDNGHLVAWSASMRYWVGLASTGRGAGMRIMNSMTSGEGLMCHFEGPGIVYLQSHKPAPLTDKKRSRGGKGGSLNYAPCMMFLFFMSFCAFFVLFAYITTVASKGGYTYMGDARTNHDYSSEYKTRKNRRQNNLGNDRDDEYRANDRANEYRGREF
jgi:uncharacterized protein (TIGR00266 family)